MNETSIKLNELNDQLNKLNKELNEQMAQNKLVLGMVAHDLKQPLANIKGLVSLAELEEELSENIKESNELILKSVINAESLILDLLDISKIENSNIQFEKLCTFQIKEDLNHALGNQLKQKQIRLEVRLETPFILGSKSLINRMLINLLTNSIKFSYSGSHIVLVLGKQADNEYLIRVIDQGIGMSEKMVDNLFKPFNNDNRLGTQNEESTGLGMAIVDKIVKIHCGEIRVFSEIDKGTTFEILIPSLLINVH